MAVPLMRTHAREFYTVCDGETRADFPLENWGLDDEAAQRFEELFAGGVAFFPAVHVLFFGRLGKTPAVQKEGGFVEWERHGNTFFWLVDGKNGEYREIWFAVKN